MASLYGIFHRPLSAVAAVTVVTVSSALPDRASSHPVPSESNDMPQTILERHMDSEVHQRPMFNGTSLSFSSTDKKPSNHVPKSVFINSTFPIGSPSIILTPYHYAKLANAQKNVEFPLTLPSSDPDVLYRWHLPNPNAYGAAGNSSCSIARSQTLVILLGWLGAKQKHLKKYADWYTSRGFNVVTFTLAMSDIVNYKSGGKVEKDIKFLAEHLVDWVSEENEKTLVFHTFSNTGWLTYGGLLGHFQKQDPSIFGKIKGCVVDSAPVASPDPHVWASGFSAAFLKKYSVATKGTASPNALMRGTIVADGSGLEPKPTVAETALLAILEKLFKLVFDLPAINRRLSDVLDQLTTKQPNCPQLYIYSSADRVIPARSVESFVEEQRRAGYEVRSCDFLSSPHVDHFRSHPGLYSTQLDNFLEDCVLTCCRGSA